MPVLLAAKSDSEKAPSIVLCGPTKLMLPVSDVIVVFVVRVSGPVTVSLPVAWTMAPPSVVALPRSEERRVGKQCIYRWSPDH